MVEKRLCVCLCFFQADVLSEEAILKWYNEAHLAKGKSIFLEQMKKFVEWLKNAEEGDHPTSLFFCLCQSVCFWFLPPTATGCKKHGIVLCFILFVLNNKWMYGFTPNILHLFFCPTSKFK